MHSDLDQAERDNMMFKFKSGQIDVLVATDIVARGIDIDDIALVINYDVPHDTEDYVHRIGRTARADRDGVAITFVSEEDIFYFQQIEKFLEKEVEKVALPEGCGEGPAYTKQNKPRKAGNNSAKIVNRLHTNANLPIKLPTDLKRHSVVQKTTTHRKTASKATTSKTTTSKATTSPGTKTTRNNRATPDNRVRTLLVPRMASSRTMVANLKTRISKIATTDVKAIIVLQAIRQKTSHATDRHRLTTSQAARTTTASVAMYAQAVTAEEEVSARRRLLKNQPHVRLRLS